MIRGLEELDGACGGYPCESWSEFAIVIVNEESGYLPIRRSLSQLLCDPCIGRSFRHTYMNHSPRFQLNDEERKERAEEEIGDLQKITGPYFCCMIAEKRFPVLSTGSFWANLSHIFLNSSFTHSNIQLEKLTPNALRSPESVVCCHLLDQADRLG